MIPYGRQYIDQDDIDAVVGVLRSDFLTQGPAVPAFEAAVADMVGVAHGVAVNSATSALHLACLALDLGPGEWLWTTPVTFVASANCARYCGAQVDFVDIDPLTYNMCPRALEDKLKVAAERGCLPKIVVPVHLCGQPCDMQAIHDLGRRYGFRIIEDASHAIGARYKGEPVGNCRHSDITVFSFHPVKIITTAEGGVALTNDARLAARMSMLRSHGITRDPDAMTHEPEGAWFYQQLELGYNYRMTELQAALGISQLRHVEAFLARRRELASRYTRGLAHLPLTLPTQHAHSQSAWHLYVIRLRAESTTISRSALFGEMRRRGVGVNVHYIPVHLQPYYRALGFQHGDFPEAESYYAEAVSLPLFPGLSDADQDFIVLNLCELLK